MKKNTFRLLIAILSLPLFGFSQYCIPTINNLCSSNDYIDNFTLNTLSSANSGCNGNSDNYILDLTKTTDLCPGGTYTMTMQSGPAWAQGFGVWIDYNQDGDFGDTLEFVYSSPTYDTSLFTTNITVPTSALTGVTRLRVRCIYAYVLQPDDTCFTVNYGETEDYNISILTNTGPSIAFADTCLFFDTTLTGGTSFDTLVITNSGCDTLQITSIVSSVQQFFPDTGSLILGPGATYYLLVAFTPDSAISYSGTLTLLNNDKDTSVCLTGTGGPAPVITVNPPSLSATLGCNDSITLPMIIFNSGTANLNWNAEVSASFFDDFDPGIDLALWSSTSGIVSANCGPFSGNGLYFDNTGVRQTETIDLNTSGGGNVSFYIMLPQGAAPCEAADQATESVDLEYSTDGGVIWTTINTYLNNVYPTLTLITEPIPAGAMTPATRFQWRQQSHSGSGYDNWILDNIAIDMQTNCNAFVCISPQSGNTPPAGSDTVFATFNSTGLLSGQYFTQITVNSNDPANPQIMIPCTVNIVGNPYITFSDSCFVFDTVFQFGTATDTILLFNNTPDCGVLSLDSIVSSGNMFSVDSASLNVNPGDTGIIIVRFSPVTVSTFNHVLTIYNNATDTAVCLKGVSTAPPVISVNPDSFNITLSCDDSVTLPLLIVNSGASALVWDAMVPNSAGDDFDPATDVSLWSSTNGVANINCGSVSGNSLWFGDNAAREATTVDLNTSAGGAISFYLEISSGFSGTCEDADIGEEVYLEYSTDGGISWNNITTFNVDAYPSFTLINIPVPVAAQTLSTRFRWSQPVHSGSCCDHWAMDDLTIDLNSFTTISMSSDTTMVNDTSIINVTFSSIGLITGQYTSVITINSNDPLNNPVLIPCTLNVNGNPQLTISDTCVLFGSIMESTSDTDILVLYNTGCDTLTGYVLSSSPYFSLDVAGNDSVGGIILPGDSVLIDVIFSPVSSGSFSGNINLFSDGGNGTVCLNGTAFPKPVICFNPDSFTVNFSSCIDSVILPLQICNSGGSVLNWNITSQATSSDNFDSGIDSALWFFTNGVADTNCGSVSGNALWFGDNLAREATTVDLNTTAGGTISFYLEISSGFSAVCEDADAGEEVYLDYSTDGGVSWNNIAIFNVDSYPFYTLLTFSIPSGAQTSSTRFRWSQPFHSGSCCDHWAIDNVAISTTNANITPATSNDSTIAGDTSLVDVIFTSTGLVTGVYNFYLTINSNDPDQSPVTIPVIINVADSMSLTLTANDATCNSVCNGSITPSLSGGVSPYSYSWSGGGSGSNLCDGTYSLTITDAAGCTASQTATITEPTVIVVTTSVNNATCNGICNGSASAAVSGGGAPYSYLWNDGLSQTTFTATGLCAASYIITVTDSAGCTKTATATVTEPFALTVTTATSNATCGNSNGSASATVGGGITPYSYIWNDPVPQQTTGTATGLAAGGYIVTVTDANSCTTTASASVSNTGGPVLTLNKTDVLCNSGNSGSATVSASGGNPPYTYLWNTTPGQTTTNATGLSAGTFFVTVNDVSGCLGVAGITITEPPLLSATITSQSNVLCNGGANGAASVTVTGGSSPYAYSWSNAMTTSSITGLVTGTYTVTVTDNNSCTKTAVVTITQPAILTTSISGQNNVNCNSGTNGAATVTATGGVVPYSYLWSTTPFQTNSIATGLSAGTFTITVTDANGCTNTTSVTITEPSALNLSVSTLPANCSSSDGTAQVNASGGIAPYTYLWNDPAPQQTASTATGLAAGGYTVTVTDANGCTKTAAATVNNVGGPTLSVNKTDVSCNGGTDGSAVAIPTGGTPPYTYSWSTLPSQTTSTATGLSAATYFVSVEDASGCLSVSSITVTEPAQLTTTIDSTDATCGVCSDGAANLTVGGGAPPYTYAWSNSATTEDLTGITQGAYSVTVTDANGCTTVDAVIVDFTVGNDKLRIAGFGLKVYPNPVNDILTLDGRNGSDAITNVTVFNTLGQQLLERNVGGGVFHFSLDVSVWDEGVYYINLKSEENYSVVRFVVVR